MLTMWDAFLKKEMGHSRPLFIDLRLLNTLDGIGVCNIKFDDDWIRTAAL